MIKINLIKGGSVEPIGELRKGRSTKFMAERLVEQNLKCKICSCPLYNAESRKRGMCGDCSRRAKSGKSVVEMKDGKPYKIFVSKRAAINAYGLNSEHMQEVLKGKRGLVDGRRFIYLDLLKI